jgi:hypothetical protein
MTAVQPEQWLRALITTTTTTNNNNLIGKFCTPLLVLQTLFLYLLHFF